MAELGELELKAIKGVSWSAAQKTATYVVEFGVFVLLARLLDAGAFGLLALAAVYVRFVQIFVEQGVGDAIIQKAQLEPETLNTAFWTNLLSGCLFLALSYATAEWVAALFGEAGLAAVIRWLAFVFPINALRVVPQCLLRRDLRYRSLALRSIAQTVGGGCVGVVLAVQGFGVWSLVYQQIATSIIGAAVLWAAVDWRPGLRCSRDGWRHLLWFGANVTGVNLLILVSRQGDNVIIGYTLGPVLLGYYNVAYQMLMTLSNLLVGTINSVTLPLFSRQQETPERVIAGLNKLTAITSAIATPCFLGVTALAPEIVEVFLGEHWKPSVATLQVLCLIGPLYAGFYFHGPMLTAVGKPHWTLALNAIQALTNVAAFLIGVRWGIVGVAAAYVLRAYLTAPIHFVVLRREVGLQTGRYLNQFVPSVVAGGAMVLVVVGVKAIVSEPWGAAGVLAFCVPAGALAYLAVIGLLEPNLRREATLVARNMLQSRTGIPIQPLDVRQPVE